MLEVTPLRTLLQATLAVLVAIPGILDAAGIDPASAPGLAIVVAVCGIIAGLTQTTPIDRALTRIDLGREPRHRAPDTA